MEEVERNPNVMRSPFPNTGAYSESRPTDINEALAFWKRKLIDSFKKMPRSRQERLIEKNSIVMSIGLSVTLLNLLYRFLPLLLRVWGTPTIVLGSYVFAKKCLTPFLIKEFEGHLNPKENNRDKVE
ncbi:MAG TPA: hypothetical protein EYN91_05250 [Candidatus Melainabacteria bacterium]|nr:hypothetical protein [Candidatus Melainabacteria bacterium]HIN63104.1 hypothetical protein [Candidatus Obscuribacterales bacterium]